MEFSNLPKPANAEKAKFGRELFKNDASVPAALVEAVFGNSPYLSRIIESEQEFFADICRHGFDNALGHLLDNIRHIHPREISKSELMGYLRLAKRKVSLLVALADITNTWNLKKITGALTDFADCSVCLSIEWLLHDRFKNKQIESEEQEDCGLFVLAVGKLGAHELNYSSDIDIVVLYDEAKAKYSGKLSIKEFFVRFTQELVEILQSRTHEGYVFRTDLRIRPDPYSTPLAVSVAAAENYYKTVGQNWERAALIKARFIAGDEVAAKSFLKFIQTFIWRADLDFNAIEDIKSVKRQIDSSHPQKPEVLLGYNVKLGKGAIREVEFYAQTQQLIWGGPELELRAMATCDALKALEKSGKIKPGTSEKLIAAYEFFRTVEHRLQMVNDEHTHSLPLNETALQDFAVFMGYGKPQEFYDKLAANFALVQKLYAELFEESQSLSMGGNLVFTGVTNDPETLLTVSKLGFKEPERVCEIIRGWHHGRRPSTAFKRVREILTELTPHILRSFGASNNPDEALVKFDGFLEQIPSAVQVFNLLNAKNELIDLMAEVMGNSPWLAANFSRTPSLVNQIITDDFSGPLPPRETLGKKLDVDITNSTDAMKTIRHWKHEKDFQVGIRLLKNSISHKEAAEYLSAIAKVVLNRVYSFFKGSVSGQFAIIAMGKLGLDELTFNSDLDLVFVYDSASPSASQDYESFVKKIIQKISSFSEDGVLYNIDARLRPMGEKGSLACSIEAYEKYYSESAWNWEFMALTKASPVLGDAALMEKLRGIISANINKEHDPKLQEHMRSMRKKIAEQHNPDNMWDIKYAYGGLFEAEFIIQFNLLQKHTRPQHELADNLQFLKDVQSAIRLTTHNGKFEEALATATNRATLAKSAREKNFEALKAKLATTQKFVHELFNKTFTG